MVRPLSLAQHTLYADLLDQGADDLFDPDLPENGSLLIRGNRAGAPVDHVYYQGYHPAAGDPGRGQRYARYLGRADDPEVAARIARFQRIKAVRAERTSTVRALIGAGMPRPDRMTGRIIEALARTGPFSDHVVLIGDAAYQTYDGVLGVRLAKPRKATLSDRPVLEILVRDRHQLPAMVEVVRAIDPNIALTLNSADTPEPANGVQVAFTSLDVINAATADWLGFLVTHPVRAVVLHGPGIPVTVPAPERYAAYAQAQQFTRRLDGDAGLIAGLTCVGRDHAFAAASAEAAAMGARNAG